MPTKETQSFKMAMSLLKTHSTVFYVHLSSLCSSVACHSEWHAAVWQPCVFPLFSFLLSFFLLMWHGQPVDRGEDGQTWKYSMNVLGVGGR